MWIRQAALVLGVLAVGGMWMFGDGDSLVALLLFSIFFLSPWVFLAWGEDSLSDRARGTTLVVLVAMTLVIYAVVMQDDSSTAALALVWLPVYQWVAVGIARYRGAHANPTSEPR